MGSFWENFLPYFKNALTGLYFTVHPNANPEISYVPWVVSENPVDGMGDISHVTIKTQVTAMTMMMTWESDDSDVFRTEKASSAPGTRMGRSPGSTGPGTEAGRWTTQYASSVWFNKNIILSIEENSFFLNLHTSLWLVYFYYNAMNAIN